MRLLLDRRAFMKAAGVGAASLALPRWVRAAAPSPTPNVVYILADDMGYGDLSCQNHGSKISTPHLDHLAAGGMRFTDAHSPSAVCTPTRYGILTGRYCWRTALKQHVLRGFASPLIEPGRLTVPWMFQKRGYDTACIGKWHLGWDWPKTERDGQRLLDLSKQIRGGPTTCGFDYYFGRDIPDYPPYCYIENDRAVPPVPEAAPRGGPHRKPEGWNVEQMLPLITEKAVAYIERRARRPLPATRPAEATTRPAPERPFFLYLPLTSPHVPIAPAPRFRGKTQAGRYGDFVHQTDWSVGQVLQALKRCGLENDTLVIFTSDNGSPGRDGRRGRGEVNSVRRLGHSPNYIYRGVKADIWEGGHRVPFIARWPGHVPAGTVSDETICLTDLTATCAALLGRKLPLFTGEDSYNILPALLGRKLDKPIREATVHHSSRGMFAIRQGKWKLIQGLGSGGWSKPVSVRPKPGGPEGQLYDLAADPQEKVNLWSQHPDVVKRLTKLLESYKHRRRSAPRVHDGRSTA
jgi:arylsulfatase A-like enzyme